MAGPYSMADFLQDRQPATLMGDAPLPPPNPRRQTYGKGSVEQEAPPALGQHNLLGRMLWGIGEGMADSYEALGRLPRSLDDAANQFATVMPGGGLFGMMRPTRIANPIRAYHGSPHQFDEFRMDRIGTGEGAQAYGHGLYFAESEPVARWYRDAVSDQHGLSQLNALPHGVMTRPPLSRWALTDINEASAWLRGGRRGEISDDARRWIEDEAGRLRTLSLPATDADVAEQLMRFLPPTPPGHMYEVSLHARPEQWLDWDRPLSGQSAEVLGALQRSGYPYSPRPGSTGGPPIGRSILNSYVGRYGPSGMSDALSQAGIPGIRYLDQGSRTAGEGTRNYVVFDPSYIEILRRYGIIAPVAGAGLASYLQQDQPEGAQQ